MNYIYSIKISYYKTCLKIIHECKFKIKFVYLGVSMNDDTISIYWIEWCSILCQMDYRKYIFCDIVYDEPPRNCHAAANAFLLPKSLAIHHLLSINLKPKKIWQKPPTKMWIDNRLTTTTDWI